MDLSKIKCLTVSYQDLRKQVACSVKISTPKSLLSEKEVAVSNICIGVWDTGATGSAITELSAKKLNLLPTGKKIVSGLGGSILKNTYLIDILLPNDVSIPDLPVTEIDNPVDALGNKIEPLGILIGMDIISMGDFSITHVGGKTVMSFRIPSMVSTDYVQEWKRRNAVQSKYRR